VRKGVVLSQLSELKPKNVVHIVVDYYKAVHHIVKHCLKKEAPWKRNKDFLTSSLLKPG